MNIKLFVRGIAVLALFLVLVLPSASMAFGGGSQSTGGTGTTTSGTSGTGTSTTGADPSATSTNTSAVTNSSAGGSCTNDPKYNTVATGGVITAIVNEIKGDGTAANQGIIGNAAKALFEGVTGNSAARGAMYAAVTLYVMIYGIMVTFGMVNATFGELLVRAVKIGLVMGLFSATGWTFFSEYVVKFFNDGTDNLIQAMTNITAGLDATTGSKSTFAVMDKTLATALSIKTVSAISSAFTGGMGAIGFMLGGLMLMAMWNYLGAVLQAMWIYLMSLVAKALLFGLAPIFITCIMFQRTKQLFDGWLSQLINYSLQPIFLFAFLGFYAKLIEGAMQALFKTNFCWGCVYSLPIGCISGFKPQIGGKIIDGLNISAAGMTVPSASGVDVTIPWSQFPISVVDVLIFYLLANIAWRYCDVVVRLAQEIAGSSVYLTNMTGAFQEMYSGAGQGVKEGAGNFIFGPKMGSVRGAGGRIRPR